jgi:hypothetical protein
MGFTDPSSISGSEFCIQCSVFGVHPLAYHVATLAVVFIVGILTWLVARASGLNRGGLVAGAVVILHASVGYPVSWTSAASSPISVAFALGAILVLLHRPITVPRAVWAALLLALGLLAREVVIVAPAVVVALAWARPGGKLKEALLRSLPLWIVDIGYLLFRALSGAGDPSGPYHLQVSGHALNNLFSLILPASDVSSASAQLRSLVITGLFLFMVATLLWSLAQRRYVMLAGLVWFGLGTLPVIFLVNHSMENYYIDFALPGLALAFGAACELVSEHLSDKVAVAAGLVLLVVLGIVGHAVSDTEFTREYGVDIAETHQLLAQVDANYPRHPKGAEIIIVHTTPTTKDEQAVTQEGNLFRANFHDPSLRVRIDR